LLAPQIYEFFRRRILPLFSPALHGYLTPAPEKDLSAGLINTVCAACPDRLSGQTAGCIKMFEFTTPLEVFWQLKSRAAG